MVVVTGVTMFAGVVPKLIIDGDGAVLMLNVGPDEDWLRCTLDSRS